MPIITRT